MLENSFLTIETLCVGVLVVAVAAIGVRYFLQGKKQNSVVAANEKSSSPFKTERNHTPPIKRNTNRRKGDEIDYTDFNRPFGETDQEEYDESPVNVDSQSLGGCASADNFSESETYSTDMFEEDDTQESAQLAPSIDKRAAIHCELLDTETTYVTLMELLIADRQEIVSQCKEQRSKKEISKSEANELFDKLVELRQKQRSMHYAVESFDLQNWADALTKLSEVYKEYSILHTNISGKQFPSKVHEDFSAKHNGFSIQAMLITPIQRPPRYSLFAKELQKAMKDDLQANLGLLNFVRVADELPFSMNSHLENSAQEPSKGVYNRFSYGNMVEKISSMGSPKERKRKKGLNNS